LTFGNLSHARTSRGLMTFHLAQSNMRGLRLWFPLLILLAGKALGGTLNTDGALFSGGLTRVFNYYVPANLAVERPVVVLLHGGGQDKDSILNANATSPVKEWLELADENQFLLIVPNGVNLASGSPTGNAQSWNDGRADNFTTSTADDISFFHALLHWAEKRFNVDRQRVYFTGSSNGGLMCYRVAQEMSPRVAAIAAFIANKPAQDINSDPEFPISVSICNGEGETLFMPWVGGIVSGNNNAGTVISAVATRDYWVGFNQCATTPVQTNFPNINTSDGSTATRLLHTGGADGTETELIIIFDGGHVIPSIDHVFTPANLAAQGLGKQNRDIDGPRQAWSFLSRQRLGQSRPQNLQEWMRSRGYTDLSADPDSDGLGHLLTYAIGADLVASLSASLPRMGVLSLVSGGNNSQNYATFSYQQRTDQLGTQRLIQYSNDLQNWLNVTTELIPVETIMHDDGTTRFVLREATPISPSESRRFYRLRVAAAQL
jgi:polyhydroxybutyrate depolymerase